jgi:peptidoglycan hydrolase CwlO-like protein
MKNMKSFIKFFEDLEEIKNNIADDATINREKEEEQNQKNVDSMNQNIANLEKQRQLIIDKIKKIYDLSGSSKNDPNQAKKTETELKSLNDQLAKFDENIQKAKDDLEKKV